MPGPCSWSMYFCRSGRVCGVRLGAATDRSARFPDRRGVACPSAAGSNNRASDVTGLIYDNPLTPGTVFGTRAAARVLRRNVSTRRVFLARAGGAGASRGRSVDTRQVIRAPHGTVFQCLLRGAPILTQSPPGQSALQIKRRAGAGRGGGAVAGHRTPTIGARGDRRGAARARGSRLAAGKYRLGAPQPPVPSEFPPTARPVARDMTASLSKLTECFEGRTHLRRQIPANPNYTREFSLELIPTGVCQ